MVLSLSAQSCYLSYAVVGLSKLSGNLLSQATLVWHGQHAAVLTSCHCVLVQWQMHVAIQMQSVQVSKLNVFHLQLQAVISCLNRKQDYEKTQNACQCVMHLNESLPSKPLGRPGA